MAKQQTAGQLARKARGLKGSYKGRMMPPDEVTRQLEIIWNEMAEIKHVTPLELESLYNKDTFYATPKLMSSYDAIFYQTMGHYFEACVFASFVAISNTLSRQNVPAEKVKQVVAAVKPVKDATGSQGFAKEINLIRSWANGTGISYFRYATDEEKQRNNGQSTVPLDASERAKIQKVVAQAKLACEVYSMKMAQAFFNEHWHGDKDINIKISNISGTGGQGETLGDLLLQLNGKPFILELKWQEKGNYTNGYGKVIDNTTNRFLRWFTSLSGDKLGGQGFNNQLVKKINAAGFWGTNLLNDVFLQKLSNVLLQQVALVGGGQPNHIFNFLLHKGKAYNVDSLGKIGVNANEGDIIPKVVFQFSNQRLKFSFTDLPTEVTDSAFQAQAGRAKLNQSYTNKQRTIEMMKDKFSLKFLLGQQITAGIFTPAGIEKIDNAKQKYGPNKYNFSFNFGVSSVALQRFVAAKQAAIFEKGGPIMDNIRISFDALGVMAPTEPVYIQAGEATIEVKKEITYAEVIDAIQWIVNLVVDDRPFVSPILEDIVTKFALIKYYTNLDAADIFDSEQFEISEVYRRYGILENQGIFDSVMNQINPKQVAFLCDKVSKTMAGIIAYRNSAAGIVDKMADNARENSSIMESAMKMMHDPNQIGEVQKLLAIAEKVKSPIN